TYSSCYRWWEPCERCDLGEVGVDEEPEIVAERARSGRITTYWLIHVLGRNPLSNELRAVPKFPAIKELYLGKKGARMDAEEFYWRLVFILFFVPRFFFASALGDCSNPLIARHLIYGARESLRKISFDNLRSKNDFWSCADRPIIAGRLLHEVVS